MWYGSDGFFECISTIEHIRQLIDLRVNARNQIRINIDWNWCSINWPFYCFHSNEKKWCIQWGSLTNMHTAGFQMWCTFKLHWWTQQSLWTIWPLEYVVKYSTKREERKMFDLPEHLKSCSCSSAKLCPFSWLGEWHRVYGAKRGELRKYRDSHDKWQSHVNGLSDNRNARMRGIPLNISRGNAVTLLLFSVLCARTRKKRDGKMVESVFEWSFKLMLQIVVQQMR